MEYSPTYLYMLIDTHYSLYFIPSIPFVYFLDTLSKQIVNKMDCPCIYMMKNASNTHF